jgi:20S proteasome alpha/beta subunit
MIIRKSQKTQERMGVVSVGPKNGGGIVLVATKPHVLKAMLMLKKISKLLNQ